MLALRVQLRGCSLLVISGHAPHEGDDAQTKDYWWQRLHGVLSKHSRLGRVIILGDFNARLGRQVGQITGALQDVQTNDNGERLLEFCEEYLLWVPSTFEHLHRGQQHTWVHPKGNKARIDYILLDEQFRNCVAWSSCDINIQVANSAIDHTLLGIGLQWIEESLCQKRVDHRLYDWEAMHTPEGKEKVRELVRQLPDVAWTVDPHLHWQILEDKLHEDHAQISSRTTRGKLWDEERFSSKHWLHGITFGSIIFVKVVSVHGKMVCCLEMLRG